MMKVIVICISFSLISCFAQSNWSEIPDDVKKYISSHAEDEKSSRSQGSYGSGKLINGKLFPYKGNNFIYFDKLSYVTGRAHMNGVVRDIILDMYDSLERAVPIRYFFLMECSNQHGGPMLPHRTHQNGLSVDFMFPLKKEGKPYYGLDTIGLAHYGLTFNDDGTYVRDKSIRIDFDLISRQVVLLDYFARKRGYKINKVIIKIEMKDKLYAAEFGPDIKKNIYVVRGLTPKVNRMHDEHFHIDFEKL